MKLPLWLTPWRRPKAPPSAHAPLLALAAAVLDCRAAFGSLPFAVTIGLDQVIVSACLPCGFTATATFHGRYDHPWMVSQRLRRMLTVISVHEAACGTPMEIGEFELTRRVTDER